MIGVSKVSCHSYKIPPSFPSAERRDDSIRSQLHASPPRCHDSIGTTRSGSRYIAGFASSVVEETDRRYQTVSAARGLDSYREQAFGMLSSPVAKRAFNLELEDPRTRDRYGRNEYGESILLARRLIESGVRLVTISWMRIQQGGNVANVWDNHGPFEGLT